MYLYLSSTNIYHAHESGKVWFLLQGNTCLWCFTDAVLCKTRVEAVAELTGSATFSLTYVIELLKTLDISFKPLEVLARTIYVDTA